MATIAIGCDDAAFHLKQRLVEFLAHSGHEVKDFGCHSEDPVDYPDIALEVAQAVARGEYDSAILTCGTGLGMSITANKVPGVRAAQCHDVYSAERARKSNDAQILTLGARVIGPELAEKVVEVFLASHFQGGSSAPKVSKMNAIDKRFRAPEPAE